MISLGYRLSIADAVAQPLHQLGILSSNLDLKNLDADEFEITVSEEVMANPLFSYGATAVLSECVAADLDAAASSLVTLFSGTIGTRTYNAITQIATYTITSIYGALQQIVFKRDTDGSDSQTAQSHLILNRDEDGDQITAGEQIKEVLDYAIELGQPFVYIQSQLDALDLFLPSDEQTDLTVAEVIETSLAWYLNTRVYIDYSTATPTINFVRATDAATQTLDLTDVTTSALSICKRDDLLVDGVEIYFEQPNLEDSKVISTLVTEDTAGDTSGANVLTFTIEIEGTTFVYDSYEVESYALTQYPTWYAMYYILFPNQTWTHTEEWTFADGITIAEGSKNLGYALLSGDSLPDWLVEVGYKTAITELDVQYSKNTFKSTLGSQYFITTDCPPGTYKKLVESSAGEEIPTALANTIFQALQTAQHDGSITYRPNVKLQGYRDQTAIHNASLSSFIPTIAQRLNLSGANTAWESMAAIIQTISVDLQTNVITIKFGGPEHLGPTDYISMLQANRDRESPTRIRW